MLDMLYHALNKWHLIRIEHRLIVLSPFLNLITLVKGAAPFMIIQTFSWRWLMTAFVSRGHLPREDLVNTPALSGYLSSHGLLSSYVVPIPPPTLVVMLAASSLSPPLSSTPTHIHLSNSPLFMQLKHCSWSELTTCTVNSIAVQILDEIARKSREFGRLGLTVSQWGAGLVTNPVIISLWRYILYLKQICIYTENTTSFVKNCDSRPLTTFSTYIIKNIVLFVRIFISTWYQFILSDV